MKRVLFLTIVLVGLVLVGCKSKKAAMSTLAGLDGEWNIVEMNGAKLNPDETKQLMVFDVNGKTISGNAGCNRMSGKIDYEASKEKGIRFSRIIATRMACMDMRYEDELLKTLDSVVRFDKEEGGSTKTSESFAFYGTDGSKLIVIEKKLR
ncbi:MAG: META domain-containing protein [Tannerellaceae bacterium]|jgi:heat shock protein HslJ|nr:META domain-containing protein [Tannerellaceae bacterium]